MVRDVWNWLRRNPVWVLYAIVWCGMGYLLAGCATGPCDQGCQDRRTKAAQDSADMIQHRVDRMDYPAANGCAFQPRGCK